MDVDLKARVLKLLKEDEEFRYAVAGLIGLEEILKRLDKHGEELVEILKRLDRHETELIEILKRLDRHEAELVEIFRRLEKNEAELVKLREDMNRGFDLIERRISALGARWGLMASTATRQAIPTPIPAGSRRAIA